MVAIVCATVLALVVGLCTGVFIGVTITADDFWGSGYLGPQS